MAGDGLQPAFPFRGTFLERQLPRRVPAMRNHQGGQEPREHTRQPGFVPGRSGPQVPRRRIRSHQRARNGVPDTRPEGPDRRNDGPAQVLPRLIKSPYKTSSATLTGSETRKVTISPYGITFYKINSNQDGWERLNSIVPNG